MYQKLERLRDEQKLSRELQVYSVTSRSRKRKLTVFGRIQIPYLSLGISVLSSRSPRFETLS